MTSRDQDMYSLCLLFDNKVEYLFLEGGGVAASSTLQSWKI